MEYPGPKTCAIQFVTNRLLKGIPLEFSIPDLGCSTFSAQTEDGDRIFGRNFDLTYSPALFVVTEPDNGYRSMSTVNLAFLGFGEDKLPDTLKRKIITLAVPYAPLDGVNEKGLAVKKFNFGNGQDRYEKLHGPYSQCDYREAV